MGLVSMSSVDSVFDYCGFIPRHFDIVIDGGGPSSLYLLGLYDTLKKLEKTDIHVSKYAGSDVAAIVCVLFCCNVEKQTIHHFLRVMFDDITSDRWKNELLKILPKNAFAMCNHRVYIYTSLCMWKRFSFQQPLIFFEFRSNRDLVEACSVSFWRPSRICYHGKQTQLTINIRKLNVCFDKILFSPQRLYQFYKMTRMSELVLRAQQESDLFFSGKRTETLQWKYSSFSHRNRILYYFIPSVMLLFFIFRKRTVQ